MGRLTDMLLFASLLTVCTGVVSFLPIWKKDYRREVYTVTHISVPKPGVVQVFSQYPRGCDQALASVRSSQPFYKNLKIGDRFEEREWIATNFWDIPFRTNTKLDRFIAPNKSIKKLRKLDGK